MARKLNRRLDRIVDSEPETDTVSPGPDLTGVKIDPQPRTIEEARRQRLARSKWVRDRVAARVRRGMSEEEAIASVSHYGDRTTPIRKAHSYSVPLEEKWVEFARMIGGGVLKDGVMMALMMAQAQLRRERTEDGVRIFKPNGKEYTP